MENFKRGSILMQERPNLSKTQGASTPEELGALDLMWHSRIILKYLRNTKDMFLVYGGDLEKGAQSVVDCKSAKQSTTGMSSIEAESIDVSECAMEVVWIRKFIYRL
ncbi:hypothetical protein Tco_1378606 [Tanacetum coccineum]